MDELILNFYKLITSGKIFWNVLDIDGTENEWEWFSIPVSDEPEDCLKLRSLYMLKYKPYGAIHFVKASSIEEAWEKYLNG